ncbi:MAG: GNAT family N-acetyltransferase [Lachnospiraceae bacterium]|nr:GNAT family N-acetyltransferase [Lachnospiraceae bacterium]
MRIRPYIESEDYPHIASWIDNERIHALWCANRLPYPILKENLHKMLEQNAVEWTDCAYVATENDGTAIGFFVYSVDTSNNAGFFKFVIVDQRKRGKGYGQAMMRLAVKYAFEITGAEFVQLNVFDENAAAKHCYEKAGFTQRSITKNAFPYQDELWSRCNMIISKGVWGGREDS